MKDLSNSDLKEQVMLAQNSVPGFVQPVEISKDLVPDPHDRTRIIVLRFMILFKT